MKIPAPAWFAFASFALMLASSALAQQPVAVALPTAAIPEATPSANPNSTSPKLKIQPLTVTIQLTEEGTKFTGTLSGHDQWPMKTSFGETNVPLSAVAGIKFAEDGNPTTTIVLHNGDSVTGALDLNHVQIETSWGKAEIGSGHIRSMLFSPGLVWTTEAGLSGNRWKLVAEKDNKPVARPTISNTPVATPTAPVPTAQPMAAAARPATPQPAYAQPGYTQPGFVQPGFAQPGFAQPPARPTVAGRP